MERNKLNNAFDFSSRLADENCNNFRELFNFLTHFRIIYDREEKKMPYHINLIDELRANENAHSRILEKLLKQQDPTNKQYEILKSFIEYIVEMHSEKNNFKKIEIRKPQITQEKKRIDLWIRDKSYAIILENKVNNAGDQLKNGGQLKRYIDTTIEHNFSETQIYVLYLPPTYEKDPDKLSWGNYFESDIHKNRYLKLSFKDDILPWLKNNVLPNIRLKDKYLSSSIEQYIDHLEGKFSLRTINNSMNMELQVFIKKELGLNGIEPEDALKKVIDKEEEMKSALNQLSELENLIKLENFRKWEKQLIADFPNYKIVGNWEKPDNHLNIGLIIKNEDYVYSLTIEYSYNSKKIYYGIGKHYATLEKNANLKFDEIISKLGLNPDNDEWWYAWEYTSFQNAYWKLKMLIEKIIN